MNLATHPAAVGASPVAEGLRIQDLRKVYPARLGRAAHTAVQGVSFHVDPGEILGLLGPNGAGKTTTLKMIAGLLQPTSGSISLAGIDVVRDRSRAVQRLGAVLEGNRNLHWKLTIRENLDYFGALKGVSRLKERANDLIMRLDLQEHLQKRVGELSRGLQQRVAIAIALINQPRVLLLDEPTLGLDVLAASTFKETVRAIADEGCGIILTTHQMEVAQALSDRIAIIAGGKLATLQSLDQLMSAHRTPGYDVRVRGELSAALKAAVGAAGGQDLSAEAGISRFTLPEGDASLLYRALDPLREAGVELIGIQQHETNLEDIYRRVIEGIA
ncbi:ABC transporter ATP-binding protein [bacterium]|nr:ABC transporter ATP-binding protein [bacterium]